MPADAEGFQQVRGRKPWKPVPLVHCLNPSCKGTCPRSVVEQGLRGKGYYPARCFECNRPYKVVPGDAPSAPRQRQQAASETNRLQKLEAEIKSLKAQNNSLQSVAAAAATGAAPPAAGAPPDDGISAADKQATKALQKKIQHLKDMDPELRDVLCEGKGGFAVFLAQLEDELRQAWARQRDQKPLAQQKASAEAHLKRKQKCRDEAAGELQRLTMQQAELDTKLVLQKSALAEAEAALQQAKLDAVAIAERATAELRGDGKTASYTQASIVTATTVKDFFKQLPPAVAEHEDGKQVIKQVMVLLEKLDAAARAQAAAASSTPEKLGAAASAAEASLPGAQLAGEDEEMQIVNDDLLDQMAEAAVPPAGEADGEGEDRKIRVAEIRERLKARRLDFERSVSKTRKHAKK